MQKVTLFEQMESISNILERLRVGELMPRTSARLKVGIMPGPADAEVEGGVWGGPIVSCQYLGMI